MIWDLCLTNIFCCYCITTLIWMSRKSLLAGGVFRCPSGLSYLLCHGFVDIHMIAWWPFSHTGANSWIWVSCSSWYISKIVRSTTDLYYAKDVSTLLICTRDLQKFFHDPTFLHRNLKPYMDLSFCVPY